MSDLSMELTSGKSDLWQRPQEKPGFQVNPTLWGYVLVSAQAPVSNTNIWAWMRKGIATLLLLGVFSMWFLPGSLFHASVLTMKLAVSLFFMVLSFFLMRRLSPVAERELQVNLERGELRTGLRHKDGSFFLEGVHDFDEVDVVTLYQSEVTPGHGMLLLRLEADGGEVALVAARGPVSLLEPYKIRLARDIGAYSAGVNPVAALAEMTTSPLLLGPRIDMGHVAA